VRRRRRLLVALGFAPIAAPYVSFAQPRPAKIPRIAFLAGGSRSADSLLIETFWRRMKELGYTEGKNIFAEYRFAEGTLEALPQFAAELARLNSS
jgi:putative ABC transport system substrate-binding protein